MVEPPAGVAFCGDDALAYRRSRTRFAPGEGLTLDEAYRRAHLPLVAPRHPRVIAADAARGYAMGRHAPVFSLVLPVPAAALEAAAAWRELDREFRAAPFAAKVAWDLLPRRRARLHATLCGSLSAGEPPVLDPATRAALARLGPVAVELRGVLSGNVNVGRLYLRAYPECRDGADVLAGVQRALGRPETGFYGVGMWNLTDDLDASEAAALAALIERWWDRPVLRLAVDALWLLGSRDDLVLDGEVVETIALTPR